MVDCFIVLFHFVLKVCYVFTMLLRFSHTSTLEQLSSLILSLHSSFSPDIVFIFNDILHKIRFNKMFSIFYGDFS